MRLLNHGWWQETSWIQGNLYQQWCVMWANHMQSMIWRQFILHSLFHHNTMYYSISVKSLSCQGTLWLLYCETFVMLLFLLLQLLWMENHNCIKVTPQAVISKLWIKPIKHTFILFSLKLQDKLQFKVTTIDFCNVHGLMNLSLWLLQEWNTWGN